MNEFEWHRQLRDLRQPLLPQRDLWASIGPALDREETADQAPAPSTYRRRWLVAASLAAAALLAVGIGWQLQQAPHTSEVAHSTGASPTWKPSDPRLAGAAIEFTAARMELQQAMQEAPGSPALQRLLARTRQQQAQLQERAHDAS